MKMEIISVFGFHEALLGIGLSYGITSPYTFSEFYHSSGEYDKVRKIAMKLSQKGGGEDKFLRQIVVYLDVNAPMYWWKQADTYKVGTVAQSESTMHTLMRYEITQNCFEHPIFPDTLKHLEGLRKDKQFKQLVNELPSGWLQRRILSMNYAVIKNILLQRYNHKLPEWRYFCDYLLNHLPWPKLLPEVRGTCQETSDDV